MKQKIVPDETAEPLLRGDPALVRTLSPQEYQVYLWLLHAYSIDWIAETMGLEKRAVKALAGNVYSVLKVEDQRELVRYYFAPADGSPALNSEELARSMASYADQCVEERIKNEQ